MARTTTATQTESVVITCDECGKPLGYELKCRGCRKDLCHQHSYDNPLDDDPNGDYPEIVCAACRTILAPYGARKQVAHNDYLEISDREEAEGYAACKAARVAEQSPPSV